MYVPATHKGTNASKKNGYHIQGFGNSPGIRCHKTAADPSPLPDRETVTRASLRASSPTGSWRLALMMDRVTVGWKRRPPL